MRDPGTRIDHFWGQSGCEIPKSRQGAVFDWGGMQWTISALIGFPRRALL
jgi:hypothetical protein